MGLIPPEVTIEAAREIGDDFGLRNMIEATPSLHDAPPPPPPLAGVSFLRGGKHPPVNPVIPLNWHRAYAYSVGDQ